jgi:hypothetical protein
MCTRTGRLKWMQAIDLVSARLAPVEVPSALCQGNVSLEFKMSRTGSEIVVFGAWSDSLFVASFEAVCGTPSFVFNSGSFPVRKDEK